MSIGWHDSGQRFELQTQWTPWRLDLGGPVLDLHWRCAFEFLWLPPVVSSYHDRLGGIIFQMEFPCLILPLTRLFSIKDDLLPHVTGGFRGRAITVGSLEYDPWMKFVRFVWYQIDTMQCMQCMKKMIIWNNFRNGKGNVIGYSGLIFELLKEVCTLYAVRT